MAALSSTARVTVTVVGLALLVGTAISGCSRSPQRRSVVLVTVDTLRADHLGAYGYARETSPRFDAFARRSLLFTQCYSHAPMTGPAMASLFTGLLPHRSGIADSRTLPDSSRTLAEIFAEAGYRTRAVVGNFVLRRAEGFDQGFDHYDDRLEERELVRKWPDRSATDVTEAALRALEELRGDDGSFFLWVHYQDPHGPYTPPERFRQLFSDDGQSARGDECPARSPAASTEGATEVDRSGDRTAEAQDVAERASGELPVNDEVTGQGGIPSYQALPGVRACSEYVRRYDGEIRYFDSELGRILEAVNTLEREPVVAITSDHGEGMGEHDYYFAHGEHLYDFLLHVPLAIRVPSVKPAVRRERVQHLDLAPTLLAAAGLPVPPELPGVSLLDPPDAEQRNDRLIAAQKYGHFAVRRGDLKLLLLDGWAELYDLAGDPGEERNVFDDPVYAEARRDLLAEARRLRREAAEVARRPAPEITEDERKKLEALGYVE